MAAQLTSNSSVSVSRIADISQVDRCAVDGGPAGKLIALPINQKNTGANSDLRLGPRARRKFTQPHNVVPRCILR